MPIYTFRCGNKHRIEVYLKMDETRPTKCPACGERLQRIYDPPTLRFVGPGFYINDSKENIGEKT